MGTVMNESDQQLIHAELVKLCTDIPMVLTAIVASIDGVTTIHYSQQDPLDEKVLGITCAIFVSNGDRMSINLRIGQPSYFIAAGSKGLAIYIPIGSSYYGLILIIPSDTEPDDLWPALETHYKSLATYF
jgi:predicted regulator of Ras-like GTPase activity (Roadblock/LC7/MglB family)